MMAALRRNKEAFEFSSPSLRKHPQFMQEVLKELGWRRTLESADEELKENPIFMREAAVLNYQAFIKAASYWVLV